MEQELLNFGNPSILRVFFPHHQKQFGNSVKILRKKTFNFLFYTKATTVYGPDTNCVRTVFSYTGILDIEINSFLFLSQTFLVKI